MNTTTAAVSVTRGKALLARLAQFQQAAANFAANGQMLETEFNVIEHFVDRVRCEVEEELIAEFRHQLRKEALNGN